MIKKILKKIDDFWNKEEEIEEFELKREIKHEILDINTKSQEWFLIKPQQLKKRAFLDAFPKKNNAHLTATGPSRSFGINKITKTKGGIIRIFLNQRGGPIITIRPKNNELIKLIMKIIAPLSLVIPILEPISTTIKAWFSSHSD